MKVGDIVKHKIGYVSTLVVLVPLAIVEAEITKIDGDIVWLTATEYLRYNGYKFFDFSTDLTRIESVN